MSVLNESRWVGALKYKERFMTILNKLEAAKLLICVTFVD